MNDSSNTSALSAADGSEFEALTQVDVSAFPLPMVVMRACDGHVLNANYLVSSLLKVTRDELIGGPLPGLLDQEKNRSKLIDQLKESSTLTLKSLKLSPDNNSKVKVSATLSLTIHSDQECVIAILQSPLGDETLQKRLRIAIQRYNMALQAANIGIWSWSMSTGRIVWDETMHELFGIENATFGGNEEDFLEYIVEEDQQEQKNIRKKYLSEGGTFDTKFRIVRPDGETRVIINRGEAVRNRNGVIVSVIGICWDATENFALQAKVEEQTIRDPLTGLLNRFALQTKLTEIIEFSDDDSSENSYCFFDIDRFKVINDTCGHDAGDALLRKVSDTLQTYIKKSDTFARMGGDQFGIIITNSSATDAKKVAETIHNAVNNVHFEWQGKVFDINASMALVSITRDKSVTDIFGEADVSLSAAKDSGRNRIHEYKPHDSTVIRRHDEMHWVVELENALREDRFQLHFQTIEPINLDVDKGLHYEVLLRMINSEGEEVPPFELLKAAEQFDMATRVDTWVINAVFNWLQENSKHCEDLSLCSINLSGATLGDNEFYEYLANKLKSDHLPNEKICFEVTENAAIKNIKNAADFISKIKEFGCKFALDDFGSGLSSFAYLKDLPVDVLKIDGMFVKNMHEEKVNYAMVKAIHDVGKVMNMKTIAEYVENEDIYNSLKEVGVDYGQGYYFGKSSNLDNIVVESEVAEPDSEFISKLKKHKFSDIQKTPDDIPLDSEILHESNIAELSDAVAASDDLDKSDSEFLKETNIS